MEWKDVGESVLRWIHVIAGIAWIGHLWFFNFVNAKFAPTMDDPTRQKVVPELMPRALFWFRWGGAFTWFTGVLLLGLVFYMSRGTMFSAAQPPSFTAEAALEEPKWAPHWTSIGLLMLAMTFMSPFVYEVLTKYVLRTNAAMFWGGLALIAALLLGYRAAGFVQRSYQIHLGALFGTLMAFNVWFRIWPAQKHIIAAVKAGTKPDDALVALAGSRSRHNTFLSVPLVFLMLNAHATWTAGPPSDAVFPLLTFLVVAAGFALTQHLYGISGKVKGM